MSFTSSWRSPSNIALIKYWGKHELQLPRNPSLSFTLSACHTDMTMMVTPAEHGSLSVLFEGNPKPSFESKIKSFFSRIDTYFPWLRNAAMVIDSFNTFPHGAGIASSASSMSAMALCIKDIDDQMQHRTLRDAAWWSQVSEMARLGSGSASRSVFPIAALWGVSEGIPSSSDHFAIPWQKEVDPLYSTFEDTILIVKDDEKTVSSTVGHQLMELHPYAVARYTTAKENLSRLIMTMKSPDLVDHFITICESEALHLHALMMSGPNPFVLVEPATISIIKEVWRFRKETGVPVCFTLDAGPNVHLLYPAVHKSEIMNWVKSSLLQYCAKQEFIEDRVGKGPEKLSSPISHANKA
jgi:diphosphomevalonate decarboxylase